MKNLFLFLILLTNASLSMAHDDKTTGYVEQGIKKTGKVLITSGASITLAALVGGISNQIFKFYVDKNLDLKDKIVGIGIYGGMLMYFFGEGMCVVSERLSALSSNKKAQKEVEKRELIKKQAQFI